MSGKAIVGGLVVLALLGMCAMACVVPLGFRLIAGPVSRAVEVIPAAPAVPQAPAAPAVPSVPQVPYYEYGPRFMRGPFGFGFGWWTCLFPLALVFLGLVLLRRGFWRRHWGPPGGPAGPWGHGAPPAFDEWHRQAHAGGQTPPPPQPPPQGPEAR